MANFTNQIKYNTPGVYYGGYDTANGAEGQQYTPQWLIDLAQRQGQTLTKSPGIYGGNVGWKLGDYVYSGNAREGANGGMELGDQFYRYKDTPLLRQSISSENGSILNGSPYEMVDGSGNVVGSGNWENISEGNDALLADKVVTALVGGALGGVALSAGAAGGAGAAASGGGAAGTAGAEGAATFGAGGLGTGSATGGVGFGLGGSTYGGAAIGSGLDFGAAAAGGAAGAGAMGAGGAGTSTMGAGGAGGSAAAGGSGLSSLFGGGGGMGEFSWGSLIGPALNFAGQMYSGSEAGKAGDSLAQAARDAAALYEPWRQAGSWAIGQSANMLGKNGPEAAKSAFYQDPGYQWRVSQGENALTRAASARGMLGSGKYLKDAMNYNQGQASQEFGNAFNRLQAVAGMGQTATGSAAGYNTDAASASAAGRIAQGNALTNGIGQGWSMYQNSQQQDQNNQMMNRLFASRGY